MSRDILIPATITAFGLGLVAGPIVKPWFSKLLLLPLPFPYIQRLFFGCTWEDSSSGNAIRKPRHVPAPNLHWNPSIKQPSPLTGFDDRVSLDPSSLSGPDMYALGVSMVVPRPIALVSSIDSQGVRNLAPFSYFNIVNHNPPYIVFSPVKKASGKKDTLANIESTRGFVVNIISEWFVNAANHTSGEYPPDADEWILSGLTPIPSDKVTPPRVQESAVHMECELRKIHEIHNAQGVHTASIIIAEIIRIHVSKAVLLDKPVEITIPGGVKSVDEKRSLKSTDQGTNTKSEPNGKAVETAKAAIQSQGAEVEGYEGGIRTKKVLVVDPLKLRPVARLHGSRYGLLGETFDIFRPNKDGNYPAKK
mmetsp:Transcript_34817/g.62626  ORF Transcript_34817/g.62626 Transcript_34817/m.62626 type:complete len:364 (-) Transcript_34817:215-1306(-)|eukprot:CAMPEP_0175076070 /NCGR_PEP_ID=MMETSP0052_2-20121109/22474_1 /TAXON_ID=51329 ORGANISM="Polytomella parva, Strain SAG 63-3" /NCGR_SAMPLE_ID=MMETSP0052_2 /ASSEMBLY_ACC=CAM_ASM_000194 /LENGTH=363 /DNA_ID=CAMNT_0016345071 /DNA_START=53 /DNA_END=1144 /DNA_ORIENTATION=+